ncbi:MAG: glycosyltransferase [Candidatus Krumholzibacteriota bacterium]|nr:glycosyltransferase [Candidatus Krumholzibacteriota bacterium]
MKILLALSYRPYPVQRGFDRLILNLIRGLSSRHQVTLVTMILHPREGTRLREIEKTGISVKYILAPHKKSAAHRLYYKLRNIARALFKGIPQQTSYAGPPEYLELVEKTCREGGADLVLISYWHLYELYSRLSGFRRVLLTLDLDYKVRDARVARRKKRERLLTRWDTKLQESTEKRAYRSFDSILTVTERDAEILRREEGSGGKKIFSLPLALDLSAYRADSPPRRADRILFLGTFESDFNLDALHFFRGEVFPAIRQRRPGAVLDIVGHGTDNIPRDEEDSSLHVVGAVEDIFPYLSNCAVMVLPLRFGSGVRMRMLEAAAMGTPVVSTPVGVEGLPLLEGRDYLQAVSAREMAEEVVRLLEDPALANTLGNNARRWAEQHLSLSSYPQRLDELLSRL